MRCPRVCGLRPGSRIEQAGREEAKSAEREGPWSCAAFTSFDGGKSWSRHDFSMVRCIDPWIVFAGDGAVLFTGIELRNDAQQEDRFRLVLYRSEDGGRRWPAEPIDLGRAHDHLLVVADRSETREFDETCGQCHDEAAGCVWCHADFNFRPSRLWQPRRRDFRGPGRTIRESR